MFGRKNRKWYHVSPRLVSVCEPLHHFHDFLCHIPHFCYVYRNVYLLKSINDPKASSFTGFMQDILHCTVLYAQISAVRQHIRLNGRPGAELLEWNVNLGELQCWGVIWILRNTDSLTLHSFNIKPSDFA